ncbi:MAG: PEP/pyruvate-binding domain-containing protein [Bdellovibrio sp.]|nr:PEP/pyruvate-binding domain-containing protein [Methylotenera sp.]
MQKTIQKLISLSLTCALILCATTVLWLTKADARRMNPELMKPPSQPAANQQDQVARLPENLLCQDCLKPSPPPPAGKRVWEGEVRDAATWTRLSKTMRGSEYSKFVLDVKTNKIYFVDSNVFTLHADFVVDYLKKLPRTTENMRAYNQNYSTQKPQFILGYLTHYPNINGKDLWTFSFWEGDTITPKGIRRAYKRLLQTFSIAKLQFRPDSSNQEKVAAQLKPYKIATINNNQIYKSLPYQAFNLGKTVGTLHIVPPKADIESITFADDDIALLQTSYPDIAPVAGIITTQFSTPLSHVNLRASSWGIPNATIKNASADYEKLNGRTVFYEVKEDGFSLREATSDEASQHKNAVINKKVVVMPTVDLSTTALLPLGEIKATDATKYGAKTANLGEMMRAKIPMSIESGFGVPLNIPDGFGVPFSYYVAHIKAHGLDAKITAILQDERFSKDPAWRKQSLADLRAAIQTKPLDDKVLLKIASTWQSQLKGAGVFVRSSTNAEDLKGFNGAGLYDTVPNVRDEKELEAAIKQVWASVWNLRAVEERNHFGIPHAQVYPAVLIQTGVNAAAAGVLLTTDIWGHQPRTYTINAKWGLGMRVVEGQKIAEQILFDLGNDGTRVISRSDESTMLVASPKGGVIEKAVPKSEAILTEKRAKTLSMFASRTAKIFKNTDVLDIEWVLETKDGKDTFWLVQARPYVQVRPNVEKK